MLPLKESHFSTYIEEYGTRKASKPVLYGLVGIGLFLLILACINYINMSVAAMPQRAKEIGVRKTLGSSQGQLILQFLTETFFTTLIAAVLAQLLIWIGFWFLKDIIPLGVTPFTNIWLFIIFNSLLSGFITILAGFYPAWLITRIRTIQVFRNLVFVPGRARNFSLHKVLIVFQFVISIVFITSALIVGYQLHYALSTDMGFNKDAVILVEVPWKFINDKNYDNRQFPLFDNLKKLPGISDLSLGSAPMSSNYSSSEYEYLQDGTPPIRRNVFKKWVDTNYIRVYGIKLLAGRNLRACDTSNELVINETAVLDFGFKSPQDAIGKFIGPQQETKLPIVGVVKDFHLQNFYTSIDPMSLESEKDNLSNFNIKLEGIDPSRWQNIIREIERNWNQFYPSGSFSYKFYDVTIQAMYEQERHLSKLINLATGIAIIISCLGLFGLAVLTAYQRTKEIGIRKVLGASVSVIVQLLSKEYIQLVFISLLISSPIAWWAMTKWLQHFAYRIPLSWWLFVAAGFAGLVIAFLTVGFQAFKAARANPVESLRTE
jgi:ABC-type antimicrobial peptide transport system permease subunit